MSAIVKGVAGVGIPAAGAGGAYVLLKNGVKVDEMPSFVALSTAGTDAYVKDYKPYFASNAESRNEGWWNWSYRSKFSKDKESKKELSTEFNDVNSGEKLKEKCGAVYGKKTSDLPTQGSDANAKKLFNDLWRFCSVFPEKPKTIDDNSGIGGVDKEALESSEKYKGKFGETKKTELVSVNYSGNENNKFWELREKEFFGEGEAQGTGNYTSKNNDQKTEFDKLYDKRTQRPKDGLKSVCSEAYKLDTTGGVAGTPPNPTIDEVVKHCGLKVASSN